MFKSCKRAKHALLPLSYTPNLNEKFKHLECYSQKNFKELKTFFKELIFKYIFVIWAWWHVPVILATWEAEERGSPV
jgi:hypothetical protein